MDATLDQGLTVRVGRRARGHRTARPVSRDVHAARSRRRERGCRRTRRVRRVVVGRQRLLLRDRLRPERSSSRCRSASARCRGSRSAIYGIAVLAFLALRRRADGSPRPARPTTGAADRAEPADDLTAPVGSPADARLPAVSGAPSAGRRTMRPGLVRVSAVARLHPARDRVASAGGSTPGSSTTTASATSSRRRRSSEEMRDYIADQTTLRLARTSNFVSAAGPVVTDAIAAAIATPPVEEAIRDFAIRAHEQVFQARGRPPGRPRRAAGLDLDPLRVAVDQSRAREEAAGQRARRVGEHLAEPGRRRPVPDELAGSGSGSRSARRVSRCSSRRCARAADPVRAVRSIGVTMAISGALLAGLGAATPVIGGVVAPDGPAARPVPSRVRRRADRTADRCGPRAHLIGLALALAPGKDGGDLADRWRRVQAWVTAKRASAGWRFAGGVALVLVADVRADAGPTSTARTVVAAPRRCSASTSASSICLRAGGRARHRPHRVRRLHRALGRRGRRRRWSSRCSGTASGAVALAAATKTTPRANALPAGLQRLLRPLRPTDGPDGVAREPQRDVVGAYDFLGAEHTITIPEQLNAGARFLMLDVYYGYDDDGIVRTNLAGGSTASSWRRTRQGGGRRAATGRRAHRHRRHVGQQAGALLLPRPVRARRGEGGRRVREINQFLDRTSPRWSSSTSRTTCSRRT